MGLKDKKQALEQQFSMGAHALCFIGIYEIQGRIKEEDGLKRIFF